MAVSVGYVSFGDTSTITEANEVVNTKEIKLLVNDDATNNLIVNIDNATTEANAITLKPGETIENFPIPCKTLYFKSSAATVAFRFIGIK